MVSLPRRERLEVTLGHVRPSRARGVEMQTVATLRYARISPQKCRLVANQIRGKSVAQALKVLQFSQKKAAHLLRKVLESAIANRE